MNSIFSSIQTTIAVMDKATVWAWTFPTASRVQKLSTRQRLARGVHVLAFAVLTVGTFGLFHIATYSYLAYRIQSTDLNTTPLYNPAVRRTALLLHAELCRHFALTFHAPTLPDHQHALIMRLLSANLTQLTTHFLDNNDTRSVFEKFCSFVQDYEIRNGNNAPFSAEMLQHFSRTLLTHLVPQNMLLHPHALFKKGVNGHYLSFDPALSEQALQAYKEQCREIGTLLSVWLSNPDLVAYPLGRFFTVDFYAGLLWFLELSNMDLNTPFHQLPEERQRELHLILSEMDPNSPLHAFPLNALYKGTCRWDQLPRECLDFLWKEIILKTNEVKEVVWLYGLRNNDPYCLDFTKTAIDRYLSNIYQSRYAALQEVAKSFLQAYQGGIDAMTRPDVPSAHLVATLLQTQLYGAEDGIKLINVALSTPGLPQSIKNKCQALIAAFRTHPGMLYSFLITLHHVELEARRVPLPLPYDKKTDLIRAIDEYPLTPIV